MKIIHPVGLPTPQFEPFALQVETPEELRALVRMSGQFQCMIEPVATAAFDIWHTLRDEMDRQRILL